MNILYWNINRALTRAKLNWIDRIIGIENPDILCIAEGPESITDCNSLISDITTKGYKPYYSPTFYNNLVISKQYGWNRCGLKVFVKSGLTLDTKFEFGNQQLEGRIIYLRFQKNREYYSTFLIHGMSKTGDELNQNDFIVELSRFIMAKTFGKDDDKIIIFGDFNIEPWENLLKKKRYIFSLFYNKKFEYYSKTSTKRIYKSPIFEYIQSNKDKDLIGTFYNDKYVSLYDFPLLSEGLENFDFKIIPEILKHKILTKNNNKNVLVDGLDHLPVVLKII